MWLIPVYIVLGILAVYLALSCGYQFYLAIAYFVMPELRHENPNKRLSFTILVPAHNEELLIAKLCESLTNIAYPRDLFEICIIADNCTDQTAVRCQKYPVVVLERTDSHNRGKGQALAWALGKIDLEKWDAVLIIDADNIVDPFILDELNSQLNQGEVAIQCHNAVGNRGDSWFTQLLYVSRTIGNHLYHHAKFKLGLSSYLMGNGICFTASLLKKKGWTAFSVGEDWEYYAQLIYERIRIGFCLHAKVYHQESKSLDQATSQRLRWSRGRALVIRKYGIQLFFDGLSRRDWFMVDASLPLIFPNYSLQLNLTILLGAFSLLLPLSLIKTLLIVVDIGLILLQCALFSLGIYIAKSYKEIIKALFHAPFFLLWKACIDLLIFTGIYREEKWIRTARHLSPEEKIKKLR